MKAKRGDIAVIVTNASSYSISDGPQQHDQVEVCEVTSVTRDGLVKAVRRARTQDLAPVQLRHWSPAHKLYVVPKTDVDVPAALTAAAEHPWPHNGMPGKYYDTLDEVKAMLAPLRRETAKAGA